jgi:hypothetical protein
MRYYGRSPLWRAGELADVAAGDDPLQATLAIDYGIEMLSALRGLANEHVAENIGQPFGSQRHHLRGHHLAHEENFERVGSVLAR